MANFGDIQTSLNITALQSVRRNAIDSSYESFIALDTGGGNMTGTLIVNNLVLSSYEAITGESLLEGTIQWDGTNFLGYTGTGGWVVLDIGGDGTLEIDTINEHTLDTGVTVEGVLLKDGELTIGNDTLNIDPLFNFISANGVTASMLITNGYIYMRANASRRIIMDTGTGLQLPNNKYLYLGSSSVDGRLYFNGTNVNLIVENDGVSSDFNITANAVNITGNLIVSEEITIGSYESVTDETPSAGMIQWDGINFQGYDGSEWVNLDGTGGGGGTASYMYDLLDVEIVTGEPSNQDILEWNTASQKWVPVPNVGGGGTASYMGDLLDVDIATGEPSDQDILQYSTGTNSWLPVTLDAASSKKSWNWTATSEANKNTNRYLDREDGLATNIAPYISFYNAYIRAISLYTGTAGTWTAQVRVNGVSQATLNSTGSQKKYVSGLSVSINAGDEVSVYMSGTSISKPSVNVFIEEA